jgi:hypothetical protein
VLAVCEQANQGLVVIEDHPLTYADRRKELTEFRRGHDEIRPIEDAPSHLLRDEDHELLATLLRVCIGPGSWWSTYIYLVPIDCTLLIWESSLIDLWSERHSVYSALANHLRAITGV